MFTLRKAVPEEEEEEEEEESPRPIAGPRERLNDIRFRMLLGAVAWSRLPQAVRERFSKRQLGSGGSVTYAGEIVESRRSRIGWLIAQACRLIGAPLPLNDDIGAPAVVTVTEDAAERRPVPGPGYTAAADEAFRR